MNTVKQRLFDAVISALQGIVVSGGYKTDAGTKVFPYRDPVNEPIQQSELPCITVREVNETAETITAAVERHTVTYEIAGHDSDSVDAPAKLRELAGDIRKAVGVDRTFGGLAEFCQPASLDLNTERRGKNVGSVKVSMTLRYQHTAGDPYTLHTIPS
jgi:hypothetical protein